MPEQERALGARSALHADCRDALLLGLTNMEKRICCPGIFDPLKVNQLMGELLGAHPELFWFEGQWDAAAGSAGVVACPVYSMAPDGLAQRREALESAVRVVRRACDDADQARFARRVYDWFLENIAYDTRASGQTAYDALVGRRAVCKGLSKAYQLVLQGAGVHASLRQGRIGDVGRHVWNLARLDGVTYNIDVSCGYAEVYEKLPPVRRAAGYFAVSDATIRRTHSLLPGMEWLPACGIDLN